MTQPETEMYDLIARVLSKSRWCDASCSIKSTTAMIACDLSDAFREIDPLFDPQRFHTLVQKPEVSA